MVEHAAKTAAQPNSSQKAPSVGVREVPDTRDGVLIADLCKLLAASNEAAVGANFQSRDEEDDLGASGIVPPRIPSSARGHASGPKPAPCGSASFCFDYVAPAGSRFLPKEV